MAINENKQEILGFEVSKIPASGKLADISRKKYGTRPSERNKHIAKLFTNIKGYVEEKVVFQTDEDTSYPSLIKKAFPASSHKRYKGAKSRSQGLGELKKLNYDPLFPINHTLAMLRANINRLFHRTWCTTKRKSALEYHLWVFTHFYNRELIPKRS